MQAKAPTFQTMKLKALTAKQITARNLKVQNMAVSSDSTAGLEFLNQLTDVANIGGCRAVLNNLTQSNRPMFVLYGDDGIPFAKHIPYHGKPADELEQAFGKLDDLVIGTVYDAVVTGGRLRSLVAT